MCGCPMWATTTVTGKIQNLGTGNMTAGAFVRFWLRGCSGNQPRINGTSIIGPSQGGVWYFDLPADSSGNISGTLYSTRDNTGNGNGDIECGGSKTSVWYGMQAFVSGRGGPEVPVHAKSGVTLDITQVTPITTNPVVTSPTGDNTYLRLDSGNSPVTGSLPLVIPGGFTNTAYNAGVLSTVNGPSGNCPTYVLNEGGTGTYATDAMTGCVIVPSTSTAVSSNAVAGYIIGKAPSGGCGINGTCTVAGYFSAQAGANGVLLWGINPACNDQSAFGSFTNVHCQNEFDQNITSTTTSAIGAAFTGYASVSNSNTVAVEIQGLAGPYPVWWTGFQCNQGSVGSQTCLSANPISNANNVNSQNISMTAKSSIGVPLTTAILTNPTGNFQILPANGGSDYFLNNSGGLELSAPTGGSIRLVPPSTASIDTFNYPDTGGTSTNVCVSGVVTSGCSTLSASLTTTAATTDNLTITGMTASGHCSLAATNASAATNIATTYISAKTTNQITVTHTATGSMTYDVLCTPN